MFNLFKKDFFRVIHEGENSFGNYKYAITDANKFLECVNVDIALLNRATDEKHIKKLSDEFTNLNHFIGSIKLVYQIKPVTKYRIIDGQHRYLSLIEYAKKYELDTTILLELYEVDDVNGERAREYFKMANTVKNIDYENDLKNNNEYEEICLRLEKTFPKTIKDSSRVHHPNINLKDLKEQLLENRLLERYNKDDLYKKILNINESYLKKDIKYFFGEDYEKNLNAYTRAKNNGCFLGLKKIGKKYKFLYDL